MAKKIALTLEIGGVKQSVSSINDLENSIKKLKEDLKGVDIGSQEFKKLQGELIKAQNLAEDLQESIKPQELEKRVGAYAKVGSAIVSSFAAAQSAISLFGAESEDVAKAAAQAQQVLTLALTAREIAEGAVAIKTVAANIATLASAKAATAATIATRALYTTLAANPYTAIALAIGAVITALVAFNSESESTKLEVKTFNAELSDQTVILQNQLDILKDVNSSELVRKEVIKQLNKEYPGFNALLDENNRLTEEGIRFGNLKIAQLIKEQQIKSLISAITEEENALLKESQKDVMANVGFTDRLRDGTLAYQRAVDKWFQGLKDRQALIDTYNEQLKQQTEEYANITNGLGEVEDKMRRKANAENEAIRASERAKQEEIRRNKVIKDAELKLVDYTTSVNILTQQLNVYSATVEKLKDIEVDVTKLEETKKTIEERKRLLESEIPLTQKLSMEIEKITKVSVDPLLNNFRDFRSLLETTFLDVLQGNKTIAEFQNVYQSFIKENTDLTQNQIESVFLFTQGWENLTKFFQQNPTLKEISLDLKGLDVAWDDNIANTENQEKTYKSLLNILGELSLGTGDFKQEFDDLTNSLVDLKFDPNKLKQNLDNIFTQFQTKLFDPIARKTLEIQKMSLEVETVLPGVSGDRLLQIDVELKKVEKLLQEKKLTPELFDEKSIKEINRGVDSVIGKMKELLSTQDQAEGKYLNFVNVAKQINKELGNNAEQVSKSVGKIILNNIEQISTEILGLRSKSQKEQERLREEYRKDVIGLVRFEQNLRNNGLAEQIKNTEDLLDAFIVVREKEKQFNKESQDERAQRIAKTFSEINSYIQIFSSTLNEVSSLANQSIQNQIDFLQKSYEYQLQQVVGDSESANKKRIELEKKYLEEKKQLEKQAQLSSLRFSLAQAIANGAQAITAIWTNPAASTPGVGQIFAGIQTALVSGVLAAQIAIINEQISNASSFRRGGLTKAQGGMLLSGPTHEQGGIPIAQMGIIAEGQEAIMNRNSVINYRDLLSTINQSTGGRPLVMNNFDDTRIVEAIAQQRQKPLRAYVLQSEITNEQILSERLDNLSKI